VVKDAAMYGWWEPQLLAEGLMMKKKYLLSK
jgi:hypothetical protein